MGAKRILIVDDDKTICEALAKAFSKKGFHTSVCHRGTEALEKLKVNEFKALLIDCMLPQLNGVDLAAKITAEKLSPAPIYLMSGIYKDKRYIREATARTQAVEFIQKPFNIDEVLKVIDQATESSIDQARPPLFRLLSDPLADAREVLKAIDSTETIHSFDLPIVYGLLVSSGAAGHLNVVEAGGDVYGITLQPKKIVNVDANHSKSYLGSLLVEKGFCTREMVDKIVAEPGNKKLGQRLVESNYISPHAILEVMADQLVIRLSKTIYDTSVSINFSAASDIKDGPGIDEESFNVLLHDWIMSKIPFPWLKAFYVTWMDQEIIKGPCYDQLPAAASAPVFRRLPGFDKIVVSGKTIDRLLTDSEYNEHSYFVALHYLAIRRIICFGVREENVNYDNVRNRLTRVRKEMEGKNYFEILNVSRNARDAEIKTAYYELAKTFHPDKIAKTAPKDVEDLNRVIFADIATAFNTIKDPQNRSNYLRELEQGRADEMLKAESIFEKGKALLKAGQSVAALDHFNEVLKTKFVKTELTLYRIWAQLRISETSKKSLKIRDIEAALDQIPPEDRHDALYHFVKGLFNRYIGSLEVAKSCFERSIAIDPQSIEARRELNVIRLKHSSDAKTVDILRADLKDVVGLLFKKKKR